MGYDLNGGVDYQGEEREDFGQIRVRNNVVELDEGAGPNPTLVERMFGAGDDSGPETP